MELQPAETLARLQAAFDASGTPRGVMQQALLHDINWLVGHFAAIVGCASVRLRLDAITNDACQRWHRDCVPLRLITTYRGPGPEWLLPVQGAAAMAQPDENMDGSEQLAPLRRGLVQGLWLNRGCLRDRHRAPLAAHCRPGRHTPGARAEPAVRLPLGAARISTLGRLECEYRSAKHEGTTAWSLLLLR